MSLHTEKTSKGRTLRLPRWAPPARASTAWLLRIGREHSYYSTLSHLRFIALGKGPVLKASFWQQAPTCSECAPEGCRCPKVSQRGVGAAARTRAGNPGFPSARPGRLKLPSCWLHVWTKEGYCSAESATNPSSSRPLPVMISRVRLRTFTYTSRELGT